MEPRGRGRARGQVRGGHQPQAPGQHPPPQQPQGAWGARAAAAQQQQQVPLQQAPMPSPWVRPPGQVPPQQIPGRGSRQTGPGGDGEITHEYKDPTRALESGGEVQDAARRGGGNGGVRGRSNRTNEILHTRPEQITNKKGTSGAVTKLQANFFQLIETGKWCLYQYRVDFSPEDDNTGRKKRMMREGMTNHVQGGFIFDGTCMYVATRLATEPLEVFVKGENDENVRITLKLVGDVVWGDYHYLNLFNLLIKKCLTFLKLQEIRREFFDPKAKVDVREFHLQMWPGYFTSIRQHEKSILLNADIKFKVMRTDKVYDLFVQCTQEPGNVRDNFRNRILGTVVLTEYNNKTYRVDDVLFDQTPRSTFPKKDGSQESYINYYKAKYQISIRDPNQPLLVSKASKREIRAGMAENCMLIPELCTLTGLNDEQRSNIQLMRALATHTRIAPDQRIQKLMDFSQRMLRCPDVVNEIRRWDLKLADRLVEFDGRVLPPEKITLGNNYAVSAGERADWTNSFRDNSMFRAGVMEKLVILYPKRTEAQCKEFVSVMKRCAGGLKWNIGNPIPFGIENDRVQTYVNAIEKIADGNPTLILIVSPRKATDVYTAVKKKTFVDRGVASQVVTLKSMTAKGVMSIATKLLIQMNCKIGGAPWTVSVPLKNLMIVGYDVCRDTANKSKSFGAMVASLDSAGTRYFSQVSEHEQENELSDQFSAFMVLACQKFKDVNQVFPERIIVYRDGVGDGQLPYVWNHEVKAIKKKLSEEIYNGETARMAFVVVSKRINTKIFENRRNPRPGTVVDDVITLPERYDFFIVSQCVNQGTVSPTSYNVIEDTMGLPPDRLQILTYKMCHMYYNWSGTVRVPAPCQYAHKLAQLVSMYLHRAPHRRMEGTLYYL